MKLRVMIFLFIGLMIASVCGEVFASSKENDAAEEMCPTDLSEIEEEMEVVLGSVLNETFKKTIRASIQASIPEAIQRADGVNSQIKFLNAQIRKQYRSQEYAENVARKAANNVDEDLIPCQQGERGSYCDAVEQYYISEASNLANRGFLDALECYQRQGIR